MNLFLAFAVAMFGLAATPGLAQPASASAPPDCKVPAEVMQAQPALTRVRAALDRKSVV